MIFIIFIFFIFAHQLRSGKLNQQLNGYSNGTISSNKKHNGETISNGNGHINGTCKLNGTANGMANGCNGNKASDYYIKSEDVSTIATNLTQRKVNTEQ